MKKKSKTVFFILICVIFFCSCGKKFLFAHDYGDITETFDDKSYIRCLGADEYEHILFDGFKICWQGSKNGRLCFKNTFPKEEANHYYVYRYAFDKKGYIAIHTMMTDEKPMDETFFSDCLYSRNINGLMEYIVSDELSIYNINDANKKIFASFQDLDTYCQNNSIILGKWYYCVPFGSKTAEIEDLGNGFSYCDYPFGAQAIRRFEEDLFFGIIDEYSSNDRYIYLSLTLKNLHYDEEFIGTVNKNLNVGTNGKSYILLDKIDGNYREFERKRELKNYIKEYNINLLD